MPKEFKAPPRQVLFGMLRAAVNDAIEQEDQVWARQLASVLEKRFIQLRIAFGGLGSRRHKK